jgi:hypothetical protein
MLDVRVHRLLAQFAYMVVNVIGRKHKIIAFMSIFGMINWLFQRDLCKKSLIDIAQPSLRMAGNVQVLVMVRQTRNRSWRLPDGRWLRGQVSLGCLSFGIVARESTETGRLIHINPDRR